MASLIYTVSPSGAGTVDWFDSGTAIRWTITENAGYSGYSGTYTKSGRTYSFTKSTDPGGVIHGDSDVTMTVTFTPVSYRISFNANGGSVSPSYKNVSYGQQYGTLPTPTWDDLHSFSGWYTAASGGTRVDSSTVCTGAATIYAHWAERCKITFNANGGSVSPSYKVVNYGAQYGDLPTPTKNGYVFDGWYEESYFQTKVLPTDICYSSTTIYAKWNQAEIIVTYNPQGGRISRYFDRYNYGDTFWKLVTPQWDGRTFLGWFTDPTGGTQIRSSDTVTQTSDFTIYAHWDYTEQFTVTFSAGDGTASERTRTVNRGSAIGTLPTATRAGYEFAGWFLSSGGSAITSSYIVRADTYLYAKWNANQYTVTFDGNGGTPSSSSKTVNYGSQYGTLPTCSKSDGEFLGWFTAASGGTKIEPTTIFQQQSNQTLYAHWSDVDPAVKWYYLVSPA